MLYAQIKSIYPLIDDDDFNLQDDGHGVYIHLWTSVLAKPTFEQLNATIPAIQLSETTAQFEQAIQAELDADAQAKGYDNINTACAYAGAPNPFQAESKLFITRRGNVWAYCFLELGKVKTGLRPMPTIAQIISELPARISS